MASVSELMARGIPAAVARQLGGDDDNSYSIKVSATGTNDTPRIQAAINAAARRGGGEVVLPNTGTVYKLGSKLVMKSNVYLRGVGSPTLMLKDNVNQTVIEGENFLTITGTNSAATVAKSLRNFGIIDLIIDGNRTKNTSAPVNEGHGIAVYGSNFVIEEITIKNTRRRGLHTEYANTQYGVSPFNGNVSHITTDTTGEEAWWNKVSDTHSSGINVRSAGVNANNTYDGISLQLSGGIRGTNINIWTGGGNPNRPRYGLHLDGALATTITGMHIETASTANLRIFADNCILKGIVSYNIPGEASAIVAGYNNILEINSTPGTGFNDLCKGLILGEAANPAGNNQISMFSNGHEGGVVDFTYSGGNNRVQIVGGQTAGSVLLGTPQTSDRLYSDIAFAGAGKIFGGRADRAIAIGDGVNAAGDQSIAMGVNCTANQTAAMAIGINASATSSNSFAIGQNTLAQAQLSLAMGSRSRTTLWGSRAWSVGQFATQGDAQVTELMWRGITTDGAATEIFLDNVSSRAVLPDNNTWMFEITVCGRSGSAQLGRRIAGLINKAATSASTALAVANTVTDTIIPAGWNATATADTTNGSLKITVTGAAATTVRWAVWMRAVQVQG
jgi:hypothetical protein